MDFIILLWTDWVVRLITLLGSVIGMVFASVLYKRRANDKQQIYLQHVPNEMVMQNVCRIMYAIALFLCMYISIDWSESAISGYNTVAQTLIVIGGGFVLMHIVLAIFFVGFYAFLKLVHTIIELSEDPET